jgi:uncharacterized protein with von Willebrand factor type A (vWA) domain
MRHLYEAFDPRRHGRDALLEQLRRLYNQLLLRTDGDPVEALRWLEILAQRHGLLPEGFSIEDLKRHLEERGDLKREADGEWSMTSRGAREIRRESLALMFQGLARGNAGDHRTPKQGTGGERLPETRAYEFGDDVSAIDWMATFRNAALRAGLTGLEERDLEVFETEHRTSCATVLLLDISHSMTPAKQTALALQELVETCFPKDTLDVVLFGDTARRVPKEDLPFVGNGPFHTNTQAGLRLARECLLATRSANRQIFMITDGKPSALTEADGTIYKNPMGLDRRIVHRTLDEAAECHKKGISLTTFMVASDPYLVSFVEELSRVGRGKAYFSNVDDLGTFVFADFLRNRRRRVR